MSEWKRYFDCVIPFTYETWTPDSPEEHLACLRGDYEGHWELSVGSSSRYLLNIGLHYRYRKVIDESWRHAHEMYSISITRKWEWGKDDSWYDGAFHGRDYGFISINWCDLNAKGTEIDDTEN